MLSPNKKLQTMLNDLEEKIKNYLLSAISNEIDKHYITWDLRNSKKKEIGYTILSHNEYCGYRGEANPWKMLEIIENTNHSNWLILYKYGKDDFCNMEEDIAYEDTIKLINYLYDKQDRLGFLLCIKVVKDERCQIESRIYNVEKLDKLGYIKQYFERAMTWYLFVVPQSSMNCAN